MKPFLGLVTVFMIAGLASAADDKPVTLRWHGQSFFEIVTPAGTRIVTDPHAIEAYGRKSVEAGSFELGLRHAFLERRGLLRRLGGGSDRGGEGEHNGKNTWKSAHVFYRRDVGS